MGRVEIAPALVCREGFARPELTLLVVASLPSAVPGGLVGLWLRGALNLRRHPRPPRPRAALRKDRRNDPNAPGAQLCGPAVPRRSGRATRRPRPRSLRGLLRS